jgi:hypothetical protein
LPTPQQDDALAHSIEAGDTAVDLNAYGEEDVGKVEGYVQRDVHDAARYLYKSGKELKDWLGFDAELMPQKFLQRFSAAADQTKLALDRFKLQAEESGYDTGEMVGLGTLICDQCNEKLHFLKPGHIPPCPKCNATHFHRPNFSG